MFLLSCLLRATIFSVLPCLDMLRFPHARKVPSNFYPLTWQLTQLLCSRLFATVKCIMHPALYAPLVVVVWCHFYLNLQDLSFMGKYKGNNIKNQFFCPSAFTVFQRCKICLQVPAFHQKENWRDNNLRPSNLCPILHPYTLLKSNKKNFSERMRILLFFLDSNLACFCFSHLSTQMRL